LPFSTEGGGFIRDFTALAAKSVCTVWFLPMRL
jgi:hypothetical protein